MLRLSLFLHSVSWEEGREEETEGEGEKERRTGEGEEEKGQWKEKGREGKREEVREKEREEGGRRRRENGRREGGRENLLEIHPAPSLCDPPCPPPVPISPQMFVFATLVLVQGPTSLTDEKGCFSL